MSDTVRTQAKCSSPEMTEWAEKAAFQLCFIWSQKAFPVPNFWFHCVMFLSHDHIGNPVGFFFFSFFSSGWQSKLQQPRCPARYFPSLSLFPVFTNTALFVLQFAVCVCVFQMCSDYEKSLVRPIYENDSLGPRVVPETHPLLQDWQVNVCFSHP